MRNDACCMVGLPSGSSGKASACNAGDPGLVSEEFHEQRSLACCGSWGCKESDMTEQLTFTFFYHFHVVGTLIYVVRNEV